MRCSRVCGKPSWSWASVAEYYNISLILNNWCGSTYKSSGMLTQTEEAFYNGALHLCQANNQSSFRRFKLLYSHSSYFTAGYAHKAIHSRRHDGWFRPVDVIGRGYRRGHKNWNRSIVRILGSSGKNAKILFQVYPIIRCGAVVKWNIEIVFHFLPQWALPSGQISCCTASVIRTALWKIDRKGNQ